MNQPLRLILDWHERARQASWSAAALAKLCGVSGDALRRYFLIQYGRTPKDWLAEQRQQRAIELLHDGSSIKETAASLGYKQQTNFTRKFKKYWGTCPSLPPSGNTASIQLRPND